MKFKIVFIISILQLTLSACQAQPVRSLFYNDILFGRVKMICQNNYSPGSSAIDFIDTTWYDKKGKTTEFHRGAGGRVLTIEKYLDTTTATGRKLRITNSDRSQVLKAAFDSKGNMATYTSYYKNGRLNFRSTYKYDSKNNLINNESFNGDNVLEISRRYEYDSQGRLVKQHVEGNNSINNFDVDFKYPNIDAQGNWLKRVGHRKATTGQTLPDWIVTRKIFYY